jgi:Zn-dependent protease
MDTQHILSALLFYVILVLVITVHEAAHAWMANRCGDPTARYLGRMTLNPFPHLDLIGTVLLPLFMLLSPGGISLIGWGKPVPVNAANFRHGRRDDVLVSAAGPVSNLLMTFIAFACIKVLVFVPGALAKTALVMFFEPLASVAFMLAFFNLLPVPPLDGSHFVKFFLGYSARQVFDRLSMYGFVIILVFVNTPLSRVFFSGVYSLYSSMLNLVI